MLWSRDPVLHLKSDRKRQVVGGDRRDEDEIHRKTSELRDCERGEHRPPSVVLSSEAESPVVIARDDPAHDGEPKPSPVRELRGVNGAPVKRWPVQGVAKITGSRRPLRRDR